MGPTQALVSGLASGTYFWRVQAVSGAFVQGPWSLTRSVTVTGVGPGEPGTPVLGPPKGGTQFHPFEAVTFTWSAVAGAASYIWEASTNPSFPATPGPVVLFIDNIPTATYCIRRTSSVIRRAPGSCGFPQWMQTACGRPLERRQLQQLIQQSRVGAADAARAAQRRDRDTSGDALVD